VYGTPATLSRRGKNALPATPGRPTFIFLASGHAVAVRRSLQRVFSHVADRAASKGSPPFHTQVSSGCRSSARPHGFAVRRSFNPLTQFQTIWISSSAVDSTIRNRPSAATSYPARPAPRFERTAQQFFR
jgi:hypothetical protein